MRGEPENQNHVEDLVVGHFDGSLTEEQETELAEAMTTSADARQLFLSYMRMEGRLHSLGRDGFLREPVEKCEPELEEVSSDTKSGATIVTTDRQRLRRFAASTSLAVLAIVILMVSSWVRPSSVSASSVLRDALQAAAERVDRRYRLVVSHSNADGDPLTRELVITVRGGGHFVVQPEHGAYVMGCDGTDYWMVRRNGPVFVTGDFRSLAPELTERIPHRGLLDGVLASPDEPLLLDMSGLLRLIERRYDIELVKSEIPTEHHIRATRRPGVRGGASAINLAADAKSGVVLRAEMNFADSRQQTFELIETPTLSNRWYHYSQHVPNRRVERLDVAD